MLDQSLENASIEFAYAHRRCDATIARDSVPLASDLPSVSRIAQENAQLARRLREKFVLMSCEGVMAKEQFILFLQDSSPQWKASMSRHIQNNAVSLLRSKLMYHLFLRKKNAYRDALDHVLNAFLDQVLRTNGVYGLQNKLGLLRAISEFDRTVLREAEW